MFHVGWGNEIAVSMPGRAPSQTYRVVVWDRGLAPMLPGRRIREPLQAWADILSRISQRLLNMLGSFGPVADAHWSSSQATRLVRSAKAALIDAARPQGDWIRGTGWNTIEQQRGVSHYS